MALLGVLSGCGTELSPLQKVEPATVSVVLDEARLTQLMFEASGKLRVVNFWATWCQPCAVEMPEFGKFAATHPEVDVVFVNVDLPARRPTALSFAERHGAAPGRVLVFSSPDPGSALPRLFPGFPDLLPVTWLIGPDGTARRKWAGLVKTGELESWL